MGRGGSTSKRLVSIASVALAFACAGVAPAGAHEGNPNFRSEVRTIEPPPKGIQFEVRNYDDRLSAVNRSQRTLLVEGYDGEPYIRMLADGTVQVNKRSPTFYLNEDRFAEVNPPPEADEKAPPRWETVDRSGRYEWHDHRIHYMSKDRPPQVKDEDKAAKIFDWKVPIVVGARPAVVEGTLRWEPSDSGVPSAAYFALAGLAVASGLLFFATRRVRARHPRSGGGGAW